MVVIHKYMTAGLRLANSVMVWVYLIDNQLIGSKMGTMLAFRMALIKTELLAAHQQ